MKTRAAVAYEAGKPLVIEEVDLEGPKAGEVLVEIKATGVCHTDEFTRSGADPEGLFPVIFGHEGAGDRGRRRPRRDVACRRATTSSRSTRRSAAACKSCLSRKTNLCTAIRATQGKGVMPDGTSRFSIGGQKIHHYMGCSTFAQHTVLPEIALAKIRPDAPFDKVCYIGCGVTTGIGAVIYTAKVEPGANVVVFGLGGIGLNVVQGARMAGADKIVGVDLNPGREALARKFGLTHFVNPKEVSRRSGRAPRRAHRRRRRLQLRVRRQRRPDAPGAGVLPPRLGRVVIIGVAGAGQEIKTRPFQLVTGRVWKGTAFGGARGRTDVPRIVDWYMDGKIDIDSLITHKLPLERINEAFDLMHAGTSIRTVVEFDVTDALEDALRAALLRRRAGLLRHASAATGGPMRFGVFVPDRAARRPAPSSTTWPDSTCTEETFVIKAGAQRAAAATGAGARHLRHQPARRALSRRRRRAGTSAWAPASTSTPPRRRGRQAYRMDTYVTEELPALVEAHFPVLRDVRGIFGHSMGGHGALALALRNPDRYRSVSAFAPIVAPSRVPWGQQGLRRLPGRRRTAWAAYDACELVRARPLADPAARRPGHRRQVPRRAAPAGAVRGGVRRRRAEPAPPAPRRLRPQLLLHRQLRRRAPRAPRARSRALMSAAIRPAARRRPWPSRSRSRP